MSGDASAGDVSSRRAAVVVGDVVSVVLTVAIFEAVERAWAGDEWALSGVELSSVLVSGRVARREGCFVVVVADVCRVLVGRVVESRDGESKAVLVSPVVCW